MCKSDKGRLLVFNRDTTFAKIAYNEDSLSLLQKLLDTYKIQDYVRSVNIKSVISEGDSRYKMPNQLKIFKKKLKQNIFLDQSERDIRENIKEIVKGYPKFVDETLGPPDIEIKREKLLLKIFRMKKIGA